MNAGVCTSPCAVMMRPSLADPSLPSSSKRIALFFDLECFERRAHGRRHRHGALSSTFAADLNEKTLRRRERLVIAKETHFKTHAARPDVAYAQSALNRIRKRDRTKVSTAVL